MGAALASRRRSCNSRVWSATCFVCQLLQSAFFVFAHGDLIRTLPNDEAHPRRPLVRRNVPKNRNAAAVGCSGWFAEVQGIPAPSPARNLGLARLPSDAYSTRGVRRRCPYGFWCCEPCAPPVGSTGLGSVFGPPVGDRRLPRSSRPRRIPFGRLTPLPTPPPNALRPRLRLRPGWPLPQQRWIRRYGSPFGVCAASRLFVPPLYSPFSAAAPGEAIFPKVWTRFKLTYGASSLPREVPWAACSSLLNSSYALTVGR